MSGDNPSEKKEDMATTEVGISSEKKEKNVVSRVSQIESLMMQVGGNGLQQKMTEEHVGKVIDLAVVHDERQYLLSKDSVAFEERDNERKSGTLRLTLIIVAILILAMVVAFKDKPEVLLPMFTGLGGLITGLVGGFGYGKNQQK